MAIWMFPCWMRTARTRKIITGVRVGAKQSDITTFVKEQLAAGHQAYSVYPLVEESETLKAESATGL